MVQILRQGPCQDSICFAGWLLFKFRRRGAWQPQRILYECDDVDCILTSFPVQEANEMLGWFKIAWLKFDRTKPMLLSFLLAIETVQ